MVCSSEVWAGRGPSPARRRREEENYPPTPLHASAGGVETPPKFATVGGGGGDGTGVGGGGMCGWRRPLPASASINVRLLDAAVQVFAASFGQQVSQSEDSRKSFLVLGYFCFCFCFIFASSLLLVILLYLEVY